MPQQGLTIDKFNSNAANADKASAIATTKSNAITYPFVDLVRFIATMGIVFIHTEMNLNNETVFYHKVHDVQYYLFVRQIFKFATICYFIIAGFLLGDKIEDHSQRFKYFLRRIRVIVKPYVLALALFIVFFSIIGEETKQLSWKFVLESTKYVVCYTSFWYIPNFLICLLTMVLFSKYLKSVYFGLLLLLVSLGFSYYSVYSPTHTSSHTVAIFGFTFYMWLGFYIKKAGLIAKIQSASIVWLGAILVGIYLLSDLETYWLFYYTHTRDSLNTLKISNQLYSIAMFVFLVRCCAKTPAFGIFRPKQETYGIYLYHSFFVFFAIPMIEHWLTVHYHLTFFSANVYKMIALNVSGFVVCYLASTFFVKLLIRFKLAWLPYEG